MQVVVNGEARNVSKDQNVQTLMIDLGFGERMGLAVAINDEILPRGHWQNHLLAEHDKITIITATQGG